MTYRQRPETVHSAVPKLGARACLPFPENPHKGSGLTLWSPP